MRFVQGYNGEHCELLKGIKMFCVGSWVIEIRTEMAAARARVPA